MLRRHNDQTWKCHVVPPETVLCEQHVPRPQLRVLPPPLAGPGELGGAAICDQQAGASPPGVHHAAALCLVTVLYCTVLHCTV